MRMFKIQPAAFTDQLTDDGHQLTKLPYPFFVSEDGKVTAQDLWEGDPFRVIGFQKDLAVQQIDLRWSDAVEDPERAVGMYLVTADNKGDFGVHVSAVDSMEEITSR